MKQILILAGGLATRLRPLTEKIPKSLVSINNEPFIVHQLRLLHQNNIKDIILCIGFLGEQIIEVVGNGHRFGVNVRYLFDGPQLLGTGGAIKQALPHLQDEFFVINGDSYLLCDYQAVARTFTKANKLGLMTVFRNQGCWDSSNVEFHDNQIIVYDKKNRNDNMHYIDYGLGVFHQKAFEKIPPNQYYDLATLYQDLLKDNQLAAHEVTQRFYEIGSFSGIDDLNHFLSHSHETVI